MAPKVWRTPLRCWPVEDLAANEWRAEVTVVRRRGCRLVGFVLAVVKANEGGDDGAIGRTCRR